MLLSMVRGFPSIPMRTIFSWSEIWEGIEDGLSRKRRRMDVSAKRSVPEFFRRVHLLR